MSSVVLLILSAAPDVPDAPTPTPADVEFFERKVRPRLAERCHQCHAQREILA